MTPLLVRNVEIAGCPGLDVVIHDGTVAEIGTGLSVPARCELIDGLGGALIPGLHDHHIHLHALAADKTSVRCGPPRVTTAVELARALDDAPGHGWFRGVGYAESVAGMLEVDTLDRLHARRPVRIQHRSGALWFLNSAAAALAELETADHPGVERDDRGIPTGRVWRSDTWLRGRLPETDPPPLDSIGAMLARHGVTGLTEATPDLAPSTLESLVDAHITGAIPQQMRLLGVPLGAEAAIGGLTAGAYKVVLADSSLPDIDDLARTIRRAHDSGRGVAVHCVSRDALVILLAALGEAGSHPEDRIEHGALIPSELIPELRRLGMTVVTQPGFLADRGDAYLRDVDPRDLSDLYRCRSLLDDGVPLALSSDAPYGPVDPWEVMAAATSRKCATGEVVGRGERLVPAEALERYLAPLDDPGGAARTVAIGAQADLVLLDRPLTDALRDSAADMVRATLIAGRCCYQRS